MPLPPPPPGDVLTEDDHNPADDLAAKPMRSALRQT
jgi:hypothetical protein